MTGNPRGVCKKAQWKRTYFNTTMTHSMWKEKK